MTDKENLPTEKQIAIYDMLDAKCTVTDEGVQGFLTWKQIRDVYNSLPEEPVSEELEEAAEDYLKKNWDVDNIYEEDDLSIRETFMAGAKWQKEQMISKAVDGKVLANGMGNPILHLWDKGRHLIDKRVKVIIIEED